MNKQKLISKKQENLYIGGTKLNFGCGTMILEGYDNLDLKDFDFNIFPYPIKDNTYDYVFCKTVLEHLKEPDLVLNELWRICKNGAKIFIRVPHYSNMGAYGDLQHRTYFSKLAFINYVNPPYNNDKLKYEIISMVTTPTPVGKCLFSEWLRDKLSLFFGGIVEEIHVKMKVIKNKTNDYGK